VLNTNGYGQIKDSVGKFSRKSRDIDTIRIHPIEQNYFVPIERPNNFALKIVFQYDYIDTFEEVFSKDLVADGDTIVPFSFSTLQLDTIYAKMIGIDFFNIRSIQTFGEWERSKCFTKFSMVVRADSIMKKIGIVQCDSTNNNIENLRGLLKTIMTMIRNSDVYKKLPPPRGGRL